jgi:hypothetical protein
MRVQHVHTACWLPLWYLEAADEQQRAALQGAPPAARRRQPGRLQHAACVAFGCGAAAGTRTAGHARAAGRQPPLLIATNRCVPLPPPTDRGPAGCGWRCVDGGGGAAGGGAEQPAWSGGRAAGGRRRPRRLPELRWAARRRQVQWGEEAGRRRRPGASACHRRCCTHTPRPACERPAHAPCVQVAGGSPHLPDFPELSQWGGLAAGTPEPMDYEAAPAAAEGPGVQPRSACGALVSMPCRQEQHCLCCWAAAWHRGPAGGQPGLPRGATSRPNSRPRFPPPPLPTHKHTHTCFPGAAAARVLLVVDTNVLMSHMAALERTCEGYAAAAADAVAQAEDAGCGRCPAGPAAAAQLVARPGGDGCCPCPWPRPPSLSCRRGEAPPPAVEVLLLVPWVVLRWGEAAGCACQPAAQRMQRRPGDASEAAQGGAGRCRMHRSACRPRPAPVQRAGSAEAQPAQAPGGERTACAAPPARPHQRPRHLCAAAARGGAPAGGRRRLQLRLGQQQGH